jgi:REP element-mobilizing transposase RayT
MILSGVGKIIDCEWHNLTKKYPHISLNEYIIMPNHFHGIMVIKGRAEPGWADSGRADPAPTVGGIIAYFKYQTTKRADLPWKLWQRNYYEHIIRNEDDYRRIAEYIQTNPLHWRTDTLWTN